MQVDPFFGPYTTEFYRIHHDEAHRKAYRLLAEVIVAEFHPATCFDFGCGTGDLLRAIGEMQGPDFRFTGFEAAPRMKELKLAGLAIPESAMVWCDLRAPWAQFDVKADLAISVEVAEHLPETSARSFVTFITDSSDTVFFTAAHPGQGGTGHVNEQPADYWVQLFADNEFRFDVQTSRRIQLQLRDKMPATPWYERVLIFRRGHS